MKKIVWLALVLILATTIFAVAPSSDSAYAENLTESPIIILTASTSEKEVIVDAVLQRNSGILGMTIEIVYDAKAMTLTNVERGNALSSLQYMTTNTETDAGYAITPFTINWLYEKEVVNDSSTGTIVRLHFMPKDDAADGEYSFSLKGYQQDKILATYFDGISIESKTVLADSVKIKLTESVPEATDEDASGSEKGPNTALIIFLSILGAAAAISGSVIVIRVIIKKKKTAPKKAKKDKKRKDKDKDATEEETSTEDSEEQAEETAQKSNDDPKKVARDKKDREGKK